MTKKEPKSKKKDTDLPKSKKKDIDLPKSKRKKAIVTPPEPIAIAHLPEPIIEPRNRSKKESKLYQNLFKVTQQFLMSKGRPPLSERELFDRLSLPIQHTDLFREILTDLVKQGDLDVIGGRYQQKKKKDADVVSGILRVHPRGFGFLQPHDAALYPQDIFIPKHLTQNAVDGDVVEVLINDSVFSEKGPEGKVVTILSRGRTHMGGIIRAIEANGEILAYVPLLGTAQRVVVEHSKEYALRVGDRIVMEVVDWGEKKTETICRVSHNLGHITDPSCDIRAAIEEFDLKSDFPTHAIEEALSFGKRVLPTELKGREDLRNLECFTIDPDTAKDFDDALSLKKDDTGYYDLWVHIADVSHYVRPGTALDQEGKLRCNSTYFPGQCIPMLPSALSDNLCSLKANVNRLSVSVFMRFDPEGNLATYRITRSVIKSQKRFSYKEAKLVLDGKKKSKHLPTLNLMVELCHLLKKKRYERGSIEFSLPDLIVIVDKEGVPQRMEYIAYDITHQLVEEFMLKANETIASHLSSLGKNLTYRIHDEPAEENMKDFSLLAGAFGFHLSEKPTPRELQTLFEEAIGTSYGPYLATSYIRRMRLALYSPENIGHYGLGLTHYCHFTSPIRRYVDLVVHRILFGESDDRDILELISSHSSEQERISAKAENSVVLLKKLRLLSTIHQTDPQKQYEAVVTRVKAFGLFFEVLDFMIEGFLHVSELENDYYLFEESSMRLRGTRHGGGFCSGDKISVMLKSVDFILLESSWNFISDTKKAPAEEGFTRREDSERRDAKRRDPGRRNTERRDTERRDTERRDTERRDTERKTNRTRVKEIKENPRQRSKKKR